MKRKAKKTEQRYTATREIKWGPVFTLTVGQELSLIHI